ncbi:MAG: AbrB/MazE/SpoVT family DNA-binding domain-containing protein [Defluviitaleaceae bacterium]|nr:AbrB/MazE/SpoVT family DNA-binding domain-containing protein [Defluviitaleaceae bacterium]
MKVIETRVRKVDSLGRVVLPKKFRNTHKLNDGAPVDVFFDNDIIIIKPASSAAILIECPKNAEYCVVENEYPCPPGHVSGNVNIP